MKFSEIWYIDASQQKKCYKIFFFWIPAFFGRFSTKKQPKNSQKNNLPKSKQPTNFFFWISAFFGRFLTKKQPKLTKNEENWQNPNRSMKFSEIWYVDAF